MTAPTTVVRAGAVQAGAVPVVVQAGDGQDDARAVAVRRQALQVVAAYPVLWALGLGGLFWPLLCVVLVFRTSFARRTPASTLLLLVAQLLVASVPIGVLAFGFEAQRVLSVLANVAVWVATAALLRLAAGSGTFRADLLRLVMVIAAVQGAVVAAAHAVYPHTLGLPLLHGLTGVMPSGMAIFANDVLVYPSWLDGAALRSGGMMGNPTWAGAVGAAGLLIALAHRNTRGSDPLLRLLAVAGGGVAMHLALSRSVELALAGCLALAAVELLRRRLALGATPWVVAGLALPVAALAWWADLVAWAGAVNGERAGSSESRGAIYSLTWHYIQQLPAPVLGYGIKPKSDGLVASVASHSTYLGLTFRAGAIATLAFLLVAILLAGRSVLDGNVIGLAAVAFVAVWCVFEDFDGGHLLPLLLVAATTPLAKAPDDPAAVPS